MKSTLLFILSASLLAAAKPATTTDELKRITNSIAKASNDLKPRFCNVTSDFVQFKAGSNKAETKSAQYPFLGVWYPEVVSSLRFFFPLLSTTIFARIVLC